MDVQFCRYCGVAVRRRLTVHRDPLGKTCHMVFGRWSVADYKALERDRRKALGIS